jgi:ABC-2 type transport system ATP-binding protein
METILEAKDLTKDYEDFSLRGISLEVRRGSIAGLFGPNGAGKSTLIKVMTHQVPHRTGTVRVFGQSYEEHEREIKNRIGYVPQEPAFFMERQVRWTARFAAPYFAHWDGPCFYKLLDDFKVNPLKKVKHLSGGQKKLLSLALAFSHGADLLVLDEPTAGLDVVYRRALLDRLRNFVADGDRTVIVASHITDGLDEITEDVWFLNDGRIVMHEDEDELLSRWKWIHFREGALTRPVEDRLKNVRRGPFGSCGLTGEFRELRDELASVLAAGDARVENASLEDVLLAQIKEA